MRHHNSDPHDALNDYLDSLAGAPPPNSHARDLDSDMRDGVDRFFDLAERAGMASADTRRPDMNATLPASTALAPTRKLQRSVIMPAWTRHLHLLSTGLLLVAVIALSFATFGPNGIGNRENGTGDTGDGPSLNGAVPIATVPDDAETSSIPYPTADECTVEPMTRDEMVDYLKVVNYASGQFPWDSLRYEPAAQEAEAIMQSFREWQACGLVGKGPLYRMQFQAPMYTSRLLPLFNQAEAPVSDQVIEAWVDSYLMDQEEQVSTSAPEGVSTTMSTPAIPKTSLPDMEDGTPMVDEEGSTFYPTIFPEDIEMISPTHATAKAYFVNPQTGEVIVSNPIFCWFEMHETGQWLISSYSEASEGNG